MSDNYHVPVMLDECIKGLDIKPSGTYIDVTYGGGGHSKKILEKLGPNGILMVMDQDDDALNNRIDDKRIIYVKSNFRFIKNFATYYDLLPVDGILADLGISSHQINEPERGFSYRSPDKMLDMRMNNKGDLDAIKILNMYDENALTAVFKNYGELNNAKNIAKNIIKERSISTIKTVGELNKALEKFTPSKEPSKFLSKVYQAIRIAVNNEMEALQVLLHDGMDILAKDGRFVVMAYHSLEDRMVKNYFKTGNLDGEVIKDLFGVSHSPIELLHSKATIPSDDEINQNKRSRSAKLRIGVKK